MSGPAGGSAAEGSPAGVAPAGTPAPAPPSVPARAPVSEGERRSAPAAPVRLAALDIGTNSVRLLVVDALGADDFRLISNEKVTTRLGTGLASTGRLTEEGIERTVEAATRLKAIAEGRGATRIATVATSATREAANGEAFVERLRHEVGLDPRVISGHEEAELVYLSVQHSFRMPGQRVVCLDIGGGSLELVFTAGTVVRGVFSFPLGAVRLTEQFLHSDPVTKPEWKALKRHIRAELKSALDGRGEEDDRAGGTVVIGSGGTVSSLGRVISILRSEPTDRVHGYSTTRSQVRHAVDLFRSLPVAERREVQGLSPDRADIILAGAAVIDEVLRYLHVNTFVVNELGIREGLVMRLTREIFGSPETVEAPDWRQGVHAFGAACGYERPAAEHVAALALALFDALAELGLHGYDQEDRRLVEAATLLRNVGYHVSYDRHHVHSYHLIRHANLPGFTPLEIELIANLARYHRKAMPGKRHPGFARLTDHDRERVRRLAGIVRLADGLDRSHRQLVRGIAARRDGDALLITLLADRPVEVELWGGGEKKDLLERAFGLGVTLDARVGAAGEDEPRRAGSDRGGS